jgi:hypothetical protein
MRCILATHPRGWELRLTADSKTIRSQVCGTPNQVFDRANEWRSDAQVKGEVNRHRWR